MWYNLSVPFFINLFFSETILKGVYDLKEGVFNHTARTKPALKLQVRHLCVCVRVRVCV